MSWARLSRQLSRPPEATCSSGLSNTDEPLAFLDDDTLIAPCRAAGHHQCRWSGHADGAAPPPPWSLPPDQARSWLRGSVGEHEPAMPVPKLTRHGDTQTAMPFLVVGNGVGGVTINTGLSLLHSTNTARNTANRCAAMPQLECW